MSKEGNSRDYKGWISLLIGACAVWISYETFMWQKGQSESDQEDGTQPGQQHSTGGSSDKSSGSSTYYPESSQPDIDKLEPEPDKVHGNGNKKNNKKNK